MGSNCEYIYFENIFYLRHRCLESKLPKLKIFNMLLKLEPNVNRYVGLVLRWEENRYIFEYIY